MRPDEGKLEAIAAEEQSVGVDTEPPIPRKLVLAPLDREPSPAGAASLQLLDHGPTSTGATDTTTPRLEVADR